jgi:tetratricopeptide (TPR) repeat protein
VSKRKKQGAKPANTPANQSRQSSPRPGRPRGAIIAVVAVVTLLVAVIVVLVRRTPNAATTTDLAPLPAPLDSIVPVIPVAANFVGSERCASCHQQQYAAWRGSTHGKAGGVPGDVKVIAPFNGTPIRFRDGVVVPAVSGRRYTFTVRQDGRPDRTFNVDGVVGGGHMEGGGTQGFVSKFPDGTWRFLPFDWSRHNSTWFCNTGSRAGKGWVPITPTLSLADCGDWPPQRILGDEPRFSNCQGCHGSQIDVRFDSTAKRWNTNVASLSINCESCHGPAKQHIALMTARGTSVSSDTAIGLAPLATLSKDQSLGVCFQCHALKSQLAPHYLPGASLTSAYALRLSQLGDAPLTADGRTRTFAYQEGHLYSACYLKGGMTCTSCHDPHTQGYRDAFGAPLTGRFDDRQCTSCHASKAQDLTRHTKHAATSAGSRCTSCHMPYLQQPEIGAAIRYARADHSIPIPRPAFDSSQGVTSACKTCHADRSETALDAQVRTWYGTIAPHDSAVAGLARASAASDRAEAARLLLTTRSTHTSALVAGLSRFVERWLAPDMPELERDASDRLRTLGKHTDLDVQATALAALHYARGNDSKTREFLAQTLRTLGKDRDRPVRERWSLVLGYLADSLLAKGDPGAAVNTYRKAVEITPNAARLRLNLGLAQAQAGDLAGALRSYESSLALDPQQPLVLVNIGIAREASGDASGAEQAYRRAIAIDPNEPLAHVNLGNVYLKRGDAANAIPEYERAVTLDPSISRAHFYMADAYARTGRLREALDAVRRGLEFDRQNAEAQTVAARLEAALRNR